MTEPRSLVDLLNAVTVAGPDDCIVAAFRELTDQEFCQLRDEINASPFAGRVLIMTADELAVIRDMRKGLAT